MAVHFNRADDTTTIQVLGVLPDDATGNAFVSFVSRYDKTTTRHAVFVNEVSPWLRIDIPKALVPPYSGVYDLDLFIEEGRFLSLNEITMSLNELTASLNNIRAGLTEMLVSDLFTVIKGDDTTTIKENAITVSLTENQIETMRRGNTITVVRRENTIDTTRTENQVDVTRRTYHD